MGPERAARGRRRAHRAIRQNAPAPTHKVPPPLLCPISPLPPFFSFKFTSPLQPKSTQPLAGILPCSFRVSNKAALPPAPSPTLPTPRPSLYFSDTAKMSTSSASIEKFDQEKGPDTPIGNSHVVFADDGVNRSSGILGKSE